MIAAKAVDIPYDEMRDITVTKGLSGWAVAAICAAVLVGGIGGGLGWKSWLSKEKEVITVPGDTKVIVKEKQVEVEVIPPE